ncbi:MAG: galactose oxidase-like domain-containing protein [Burkholderiales bacterium]
MSLPEPRAFDPASARNARWSPVRPLPLVAGAAANLPDGRVMFWSAEDRFRFGSATGRTYFAFLDPQTGSTSERLVAETGHNMFCPGTTYLPDGRLLINGGIDAPETTLFDPASDTFSRAARMNIPRGYNANTLLQDGSVLTLGGSWSGSGDKDGEVWTPSSGWRVLRGVPVAPFMQSGTLWGGDSHMWLLTAGNGRVLHAGPQRDMAWIDPAGEGRVIPIGPRGDDPESVSGTTVMFEPERVLKAGGTASPNGDTTANRSAVLIDLRAGPSVRRVASMHYARVFHNSVVLPNGQVVVLGGQTRGVLFSNDFAVLPPELFDPVTETFTVLPAMSVPRTYHGVALLLADGRVLASGGGLCNVADCGDANHPDYQALSPPYLFNADGTPAVRPAIASAPDSVAYGRRVRVTGDASIRAFAMVRLSIATHSINHDQRRVPIPFRTVEPGVFELEIPSNPGVLLPGAWMLFAMNANGTPSMSRTVTVGLDGAPAVSNPGDVSWRAAGAVRLAMRGVDPGGRALAWRAQGLPPGVTIDAASGLIQGAPEAPGRHVVTVVADNGLQAIGTWFVVRVE